MLPSPDRLVNHGQLYKKSAAEMSSQTPKSGSDIVPQEQIASSGEKFDTTSTASHLDKVESDPTALGNLVYTDEDEEPEIHFRTWIAYGSMLLLIYCQNMSLSGPPSVVSNTIPCSPLLLSPPW